MKNNVLFFFNGEQPSFNIGLDDNYSNHYNREFAAESEQSIASLLEHSSILVYEKSSLKVKHLRKVIEKNKITPSMIKNPFNDKSAEIVCEIEEDKVFGKPPIMPTKIKKHKKIHDELQSIQQKPMNKIPNNKLERNEKQLCYRDEEATACSISLVSDGFESTQSQSSVRLETVTSLSPYQANSNPRILGSETDQPAEVMNKNQDQKEVEEHIECDIYNNKITTTTTIGGELKGKNKMTSACEETYYNQKKYKKVKYDEDDHNSSINRKTNLANISTINATFTGRPSFTSAMKLLGVNYKMPTLISRQNTKLGKILRFPKALNGGLFAELDEDANAKNVEEKAALRDPMKRRFGDTSLVIRKPNNYEADNNKWKQVVKKERGYVVSKVSKKTLEIPQVYPKKVNQEVFEKLQSNLPKMIGIKMIPKEKSKTPPKN